MKKGTISLLRRLATLKIASDSEEWNVNDWAGGNIDDAYYLGVDHGEVGLARIILEMEELE